MASLPTASFGLARSSRSLTARHTAAFRGVRITLRGLIALVVMAFILAAAFTAEANLLLLLFGIVCGMMLYNLVACLRAVRKVEVDRSIAQAAVAGRPLRIVYNVRNRHRWSRVWGLRVGESVVPRRSMQVRDGFIMSIDPGSEQRVEVTVICPRRGRVQLGGIRVSSGFPFGLFICRVDFASRAELIVYPAVGRVRREFWQTRASAEGAGARRMERGQGQDDFHGVREYRQGDSPRWIHWRRSAHTGQLVVREQQPVRDQQVVIVVDPWPVQPQARPAGRSFLNRVLAVRVRDLVANVTHADPATVRTGPVPGPEAEVERVISAAATTACEALDRGQRVGLICRAAFSTIVPPAAGRAHRGRLLEQLAMLTPGAQAPLDQLLAAARWLGSWNSRLLLFTSESTQTHSRLVRTLSVRSDTSLVSPQSGQLDKLFDLAAAGDERGAG